MRRILVPIETWLTGRDLEQHAARSAKVNCPEIVAIDDRRDLIARFQQSLAHLELLCAVLDGEGDVVDRACALPGVGDVRNCLDVDEIRPVPARDAEAFDAIRRIDFLIAHELEQFGRGAFVPESERGGVETADRVILADAAAGPWRAHVSLGLDQREAIAIGTSEMETLLAESLVRLEAVHAERGKAPCPERQRAFRHGENGLPDFADSRTPVRNIREGEIGHDRARRANLVAIVEVIDVGGVEVHRFLHSAQAERLGEKGAVGLGFSGQRRDVVQTSDLIELPHGDFPLCAAMITRSDRAQISNVATGTFGDARSAAAPVRSSISHSSPVAAPATVWKGSGHSGSLFRSLLVNA